MDINYVVVLLVGLATLFVGYFVGQFEGRGQGGKKDSHDPMDVKTVPPPTNPRENNLLRLSLDPNNQMRLDLDGQRADAAQLTPDQRKRLIDLMVIMRPWIDASAPKPPAPSQPIPAAASAASVSQPVSRPIPTTPASKKEEAEAPTSMVAQIDAILQEQLAASPLANRGIRLVESPEGGVTVYDGTNKYGGVSDVPDPQVQAAIRLAIAAWEKKYTPGG